MDYTLHTLSNGLRIAHKRVAGTRLVHCGYIIHTGSRNDGDFPGMAHCLEHMVFKGTQKRKTIHVLNHLEVVGGEMNAFTTKEITAIYAAVQSTHFQRAVDILTDVTFSSVIPPLELEKEKKVITEEIHMYQDTPEENIYDEFHELAFGSHPLAHNVLGTEESLNRMQQSDVLNFTAKHYQPENMAFSVVGNISLNRVIYALEKFMKPIAGKGKPAKTKSPEIVYSPQSLVRETDFVQAYSMLGIPTYSENHPNKWRLLLLNNLLGGPGLNSRLNLAIREKYGFTYHVESGYQAYSDTGLFHCYLSSEKKHIQRSMDLVLKEIHKLRNQKLGLLQMSRFKNQFIGQMVMADESKSGLMIHNGKGILTDGYAISLKEVIGKIQEISALDLLETANDVFKEAEFSYLTYLPE
jgi:predicted Zn-dependent peptidase